MLRRDNAVVFLGAWLDACSLWRLYMPHLSMPGSTFFCFIQKPDFSVIAGNDVCVVQRCCTMPQFEFLKTVAALDMRIIYDLDDNVWEIPETNPAHAMLSQHRDGFNACIRMVDVVSVSTKSLAQAVRKHVKQMTNARTGREIPIVVAENRIESRMFVPACKPSSKVVVGWAGSTSHIGDLPLIEAALLSAATDNPNIGIEFRGLDVVADSPLKQLPNYSFKYWTPVAEFGCRMPLWGWSVALAPVTAHVFNEAKSCIKMLEAAWCKIPCLASWVRPYDEFCSRDRDLRWLLCPAPSAWDRKLRDLVNDEAMRDYYGQKMHEVMLKYYSLDRPHEGWGEVFRLANLPVTVPMMPAGSNEVAPGIEVLNA